ncbi:MAG: tRNA (guanosine(46)-N7)-methyltransferase TrmB [Lachnospiraceae bacterium]
MRLRNIPIADEVIEKSEYVIKKPEELKGTYKDIFENKEIHIEIGMGKGRFLMEMAERNPEIQYIGIEKYSSVLLRAIQKMEERKLNNLKFLLMDATQIHEIFAAGEIDKIYLNFSDPWPKDRHAKRRLPSRQFLERFDFILKKGGTLEFKTDNKLLFEFAVEEVEPAGWKIDEITYDLHKDESMNMGNVMTEYEEKFSSKGNPIYKYIISRD